MVGTAHDAFANIIIVIIAIVVTSSSLLLSFLILLLVFRCLIRQADFAIGQQQADV
jgi:hypothetical protein